MPVRFTLLTIFWAIVEEDHRLNLDNRPKYGQQSEQSKRNALDSSVFEAVPGAMKGTENGIWLAMQFLPQLL